MPRSLSELLPQLQSKENWPYSARASPGASEKALREGDRTGLGGAFPNAARDQGWWDCGRDCGNFLVAQFLNFL